VRRGASIFVVAGGVTVLLGSYIAYNVSVVMALRHEAERTGTMYARVYAALADSTIDPQSALFDLAQHIRESRVPVVLTDARGNPTNAANTPFDSALTDPGMRGYIAELDRQNPPIGGTGGRVHVGNPPLVRELRVIPALLAVTMALLLGAGIYILRVRERADRERVWAGMARESAHQLGTPLSSLSGWIELLREREGDPLTESAITHMTGDLDRLERVAHRFERIGRPPRKEPVNAGDLVERTADYFRARVPTLAHAVAIGSSRGEEAPLLVDGDPVLLEWALEVLMKNAVDALAGRGGRIYITTERIARGVRIRVADDGPGVPRELRSRIFDPGFSTKDSGWGVGLSLAKRIVEEAHGGRLMLVPSSKGATFDVILP
jgi:signal transduction histidine kinase